MDTNLWIWSRNIIWFTLRNTVHVYEFNIEALQLMMYINEICCRTIKLTLPHNAIVIAVVKIII